MTRCFSPSPFPARRCLLTAGALVAAFALLIPDGARAQQKPAPKAAPKGQQQPAPEAAKPGSPEVPPLTYSSWTKMCGKSQEAGGKTMCRIGKDGRLDNGMPMVGAVLTEVEGEARKTLQVMLPLGIMLPRGTRVLIDSDEQGAMVLPIIVCAGGGCMAQTEANAEMVAKLKKGQNLFVQAYNMQQAVFTLSVPLSDFAKAYDGPATDPKEIEERNKKLQEELEKRGRDRMQQPQK
jgi:invasion protein IalB